MPPNRESNQYNKPYDKYIVVGDFDVSDESDYYRDEERYGELYIKNAMYYPIKEEDYYFLKKAGDLEVEKRTKRIDMYCRELRLVYNEAEEGLFINFIDRKGLKYLKDKGYRIKSDT